jgi:GTP-binding protein EngB required for normal cell division
VSGDGQAALAALLGDYVQRREQLAALVLIMDSRRPFTDLDVQMLEWFAPTGKPIHCILTKVDKLNRNESTNVLRQAARARQLRRRGRQRLPVHRAAVLGPQAHRHRRSQRQDHRTGWVTDDEAAEVERSRWKTTEPDEK